MPDEKKFQPIPVMLTADMPLTLRSVFGVAWANSFATLRAANPGGLDPKGILVVFRMFESGFCTALSLVDCLSEHAAEGSVRCMEGCGRIVNEAAYHVKNGLDFEPGDFGL